MGASAEQYAARMRGPEPDQEDDVVMALTRAIAARHARHQARTRRIFAALQINDEIDGEAVYV